MKKNRKKSWFRKKPISFGRHHFRGFSPCLIAAWLMAKASIITKHHFLIYLWKHQRTIYNFCFFCCLVTSCSTLLPCVIVDGTYCDQTLLVIHTMVSDKKREKLVEKFLSSIKYLIYCKDNFRRKTVCW